MPCRARRRRTSAANECRPQLGDLRRLLRARLPELRRNRGVRSLGIFGSYVHGKQGKRSDVDILIEYDRPPTLLQFVRLERELSEQLGAKVDLVMKSALKPAIGERILREVMPV